MLIPSSQGIISEHWRDLPIEYLSVTVEAPLRIRTPMAAGSVIWLYDPPSHLRPLLSVWIDHVLATARALASVRFVDFKWDAASFARTYRALGERGDEARVLEPEHGRAMRDRSLDAR